MGEVADAAVEEAEIDDDRRTAKPRMGFCARVGRVEPAEPRNVGGQFENAPIVNLVVELVHDRDAGGWSNRFGFLYRRPRPQ
jgi:hypothetical protein